jgi:WD40 repeat protein
VARKRFIREAQAAAAVRNEHVIDIHAVEEANERPYLVMEYVSGISLQERLDRSGPLQLKEILRIGIQTAAGLAAAHAHGLIHRDVKPANILLENGVERVKLTDFGLAWAVDDASLTQSGVVAGTPQYMAPEQARGEPADHRADLFSLGSVLYAMGTGRPPFRASGSMAVLKRVCEDTPRPIQEINPEVPAWLAALIARLHAKDPAERFPSAAAVGEVLSRHLAHLQQPALGTMTDWMPSAPRRTGGPRHRRRRWAVVAALVLCVLGGLGLTEATGVTRVAATVLHILTPDGTLVVEVGEPDVKVTVEGDGGLVITGPGRQEVRLRPGSYRLLASKDGKPIKSEIVTIARGDRQVVKVSLEPTRPPAPFAFIPPPPGPLDRLDPERIPAAERFAWQPPELVAVLGEHRQRLWGWAWSVAWSADGKSIASGGTDDVIRIWDAATMRERAVLRGPKSDVLGVAFAPDGRRLLSIDKDPALRWWDLETRTELGRVPFDTPVWCVALSVDGRRALSGHEDKTLRLWDMATLRELRRFRGHAGPVRCVAFSPDGRRVLSGGHDHTVCLWDVASGEELRRLEGHTGLIGGVAFSPDGHLALSANDCQGGGSNRPAPDYELRLWDLDTGKELRRFVGHAYPVRGVAFSPDGRQAFSWGDDGTLRSWEVETGKEVGRFEGHAGPVRGLALSPDGRRAVSGGEDCTVRLWDTAAGQEVRALSGPTGWAMQVTFSADGGDVLVASGDRVVRVWDVAQGKETGQFQGHTDPVSSLALSPDGCLALSGSSQHQWFVPQPDNGDRTGPWRLWDVATGKELRRLSTPPGQGGGVAFSPDGRLVLTGWNEQVVLWEVRSGRELRSLDGHGGVVSCVAFSPDGRRALSGSWDRTVRLWDIASGAELRRFKGHTRPILRVAFSPNGWQAVSGSADGTVRLWDLAASESPGRIFFTRHTSQVSSVRFGPAGMMLYHRRRRTD